MFLPNQEAGNDSPHKGVSQDGSHIPEKMSLKDKIKCLKDPKQKLLSLMRDMILLKAICKKNYK